MKRIVCVIITTVLLVMMITGCVDKEKLITAHYSEIDLSDFQDGFHHARYRYVDEIPPWDLYNSDQIIGIAENILAFQNDDGGWPRNIDYQRIFQQDEISKIITDGSDPSTLDNRNTYAQIRYLCCVWQQVKNINALDPHRYLTAAVKGIEWILSSQNPVSGGFAGYDVDAITFNDDVMTGTLRLLRDISQRDGCFSDIPNEICGQAQIAYDKGIECILKTQILITLADGTVILTAWCQQHSNEEPYAPMWARSFEPPAICSRESFEILKLLMEIPNPDDEVILAVRAGCEFFSRDDVRISGKRIETVETDQITLNGRTYTTDRFMIDDPDAKDVWARFYALDRSYDVITGARNEIRGDYPAVLRPIWCDMECSYVPEYNDLSRERRNGYDYVVYGGDRLLRIYEEWEKTIAE